MKNKFLLISLLLVCNSYAAVEDDLKKSTKSALNKIDNQKEVCFKKAEFSATANGCLEEAFERQKVIVDTYIDIKVRKQDPEQLLRTFKDQDVFNRNIEACDVLLELSSPNDKYYYVYNCKLNALKQYFEYQ
ncbi:hypothetical protein H2788_11925 [Acinetobacter seifertii]|uniref:hypothetical protein n=1 Tax=Acinetobacter seifertii TaxID=1530123 RepID=UPI0032196CFD